MVLKVYVLKLVKIFFLGGRVGLLLENEGFALHIW